MRHETRQTSPACCTAHRIAAAHGIAAGLDPEAEITQKGHQTVKKGDDGKMLIYSRGDEIPPERVARLQKEIARLPKPALVKTMCHDFVGSLEIAARQLISTVRVTVADYAADHATIICIFRYQQENRARWQFLYFKKGHDGLYMVMLREQ
ncbi:hypothetical protein IGB42_04068 [Andreprevotia sp. IGB-42]|uniref:hypothetical protein n=1 Tax=Andreprevotia sp. IGB-42 TaxID=2497473 RepID=UPI0013582475|nr:hypothetical protein [Andreprevotia sp. IGB-42]KAF0811450.1 hypothetical protein IGB42_04068 [Andreprevotia sp. IGB-42]